MRPRQLIRRSWLVFAVAAAAVVLAAAPAGAHVGNVPRGFSGGFLHPVLGFDHLLAMLAVGIVATSAVRFAWWVAPAGFLAGMLVGGTAGAAGWAIPLTEALILVSVIALGLVVAGAIGQPGLWLVPVIAVAGVAHGNAHGLVAPTAANPSVYIGGFLLATALLHLVGAAGGHAIRRQSHLRMVFGGITALTGVLLLAG